MQEWLQNEKQEWINGQSNKKQVTISFNYLIINQRMSSKMIRLAPLQFFFSIRIMLDLLFLFYLLFFLLPPLSLLSERDKRMLNAKFMEGQSKQELQISVECSISRKPRADQ